ncbi:Grx4 family monothiol glutaredoxin [Synechococcus sp. PCC 7336]|uniref:Grx4 family monothiol glutaredoxin n=1 Tax=Synechococcus sp. PCC 7336 TaxID=195250 RepID=UPI00034C1C92|nr:Grx4 family monothiol glutaredoxin [Synechococcus sp. PCC 7336]
MSDAIHTTIQQQVDNNKIMIYMKGTPEFPQCGFSAATIQVFERMGYPYATANVLDDDELRQGIKTFSNWPTIPQVYIDGEFVGGCDIALEMYNRGELEPLVKAAVEGAKA